MMKVGDVVKLTTLRFGKENFGQLCKVVRVYVDTFLHPDIVVVKIPTYGGITAQLLLCEYERVTDHEVLALFALGNN